MKGAVDRQLAVDAEFSEFCPVGNVARVRANASPDSTTRRSNDLQLEIEHGRFHL
jgi:hypothetical protein